MQHYSDLVPSAGTPGEQADCSYQDQNTNALYQPFALEDLFPYRNDQECWCWLDHISSSRSFRERWSGDRLPGLAKARMIEEVTTSAPKQ
ncbi:hypothetical protein CB1_001904003 [Camelus ferus]|nr:hypothetical protein CB1_001904003 [Camelus ferus]